MLADPVLAEARFRERQPLYRRLARHTVETANLTPAETVQALLASLATGWLDSPFADAKLIVRIL